MTRRELERRADALAAARVPFVSAIVVRVSHPASVRPGDSAIVHADGTMEGFVGGECAQSSVRLQALRALETGEPVLMRIVPDGVDTTADEGAVTVENPCLSGGALEVFVEPRLPAPRIAVLGDTPIALALEALGGRAGFDVVLAVDGELETSEEDAAVVVASHGRGEEHALARALTAQVPYVGLVASKRRGAGVIGALRDEGVDEHDLARLRTPAGLEIGAETPEEIALAILAEIVSTRRSAAAAADAAVDPVCGMTVAAVDSSPHAEHEGETVWFCGDGCKQAFEAEPARYATTA